MPDTNFDRKWIDQYPELGRGPVSTEPCTSEAYYRLERERVFGKVWLKVGRVEDVAGAGDYFVREIPGMGASVLVVRGEDGHVRAFQNICPHRGNRLVWGKEACGSGRSFHCGFHGWAFSNAGRLMSVPDERMFYDLDKEERGLIPVASDVWEGFIFINLDPAPEETLAEYLGEMGEHLRGVRFADFPVRYAYRAEIEANWKVCLDAFSEAYHVLFVHRESVGAANVAKDNPLSHPLSVQLYRRHRTAIVPGNPAFKPTRTGALASKFGLTSLARGAGMDTLPPQINPERRADFNLDLNVIFPNFLVHVRPGEYFTHQFWPLSKDRTLWEGVNCYPVPTTPGQRFSQEYSHLARRNTWLEDIATMEATHAALASGALGSFVLSDTEILVRHGYKVLEDHVGFGRG